MTKAVCLLCSSWLAQLRHRPKYNSARIRQVDFSLLAMYVEGVFCKNGGRIALRLKSIHGGVEKMKVLEVCALLLYDRAMIKMPMQRRESQRKNVATRNEEGGPVAQ